MHLREDGFDFFRCDRNLSLGINLANMAKILKCCGNEDSVTLRANEEEDSCTFLFENQGLFLVPFQRLSARGVCL